MLDTIIKLLSADKGRVTIQIATLFGFVCGAFYFGMQTKDFVTQQKRSADALEKLLLESEKARKNEWSYTMQRQFADDLRTNNKEIGLAVPVVSDIKIQHSN